MDLIKFRELLLAAAEKQGEKAKARDKNEVETAMADLTTGRTLLVLVDILDKMKEEK